MKRKILSLILVFAMTVSLLTVGTGAVEPAYGDTAGHWAESSIERWSGHGIIQGSNGLFDPNGQLTCAQLATILAKLLKLPAAKDAGFTDNTADAWYYDAINRCAAAGILNGNGDGTVTPEAPITRERAMVMLARALGIEPIREPDLTKYTDAAQVSAYAQGYVAALIEAGIVGGVTADELAPQDNINRASTVTIFDRAISTYADKAGATVKADGKGIVLVVADDVTVTGNVDKLLVPADNVDVTVSGSKNIDDITVTGDNSKVILNNSTANDVTLDGKNTELETKSGSKVENVSVTEDAKGATVNAGSGTTVKNVENSAADTTITGSGSVKNVASDTDVTVETKGTEVKNTGNDKITVTDAKGKDSTVSATGSGSSTTVNKETTSSGGGYSHSHSYDTSKWVFDDTKHWHASTCGHNLKIDEAEHTYENDVCTVCGQVKADVAVAKIGSQNYKTLAEAVAAGGDVTLLDNVVVSEPVIVNKTVILNMNRKSISNTAEIWNDAAGAWSLISVRNGGDLTITGNGKLQAKENDCFAVDVQDEAKLTIENGTFVGNVHAVYVYQGELTVKGGTYSIQQIYSSEKPYEYVLNCYDAHRTDGTAKIIVTGGTFEKFNPANCAAEGTGTNFVAAGYTAKKLEGDKYQVVALFDGGTGTAEAPFTVATAGQLKAFAADVNGGADYAGKFIKLTGDINLENEEWTPIGTAEHPFSGTIKGNNKTISGLNNCLIKYATGNINIDDLNIKINFNDNTADFVGGLIGVYDTKNSTNITAEVLINNVDVTGSIVAKDKAGGIIGSTYNSSVGNGNDIDFKLIGCTNSATVTAKRAGGLIGTSCAYLRGDSGNIDFKLTIDGCENTAAISSPTDSGNYRAGGFIGYCGGYGNYVFNSIKNSGTDCLIGISRIGSTARAVNNQGLIKDEYASVLATDDYDYYYGSDADSITMRLWKWHSSLEQTQGSKDSSYKYVNPKSMLGNDEWGFTIDGKHYKFASGAVHIRGVKDGVEQTSHVAINSNPNTYVIDGISVEYVKNKSMNISGTVQNWTGWMAKIGAGTYSFDPKDYIPHNERANYTITDNENGTWTVAEKTA